MQGCFFEDAGCFFEDAGISNAIWGYFDTVERRSGIALA
jgi:hypothetical protein